MSALYIHHPSETQAYSRLLPVYTHHSPLRKRLAQCGSVIAKIKLIDSLSQISQYEKSFWPHTCTLQSKNA
jgi:hypothetical protein